MKKAPLMTRWAESIDPAKPLPEYPRPQLVRKEWQNLNGIWEFQPGSASDEVPFGKELASKILVPFPVESAISGVMKHHDRLWYRRTFIVPSTWKDRELMLNFGAVDYECEVFINSKRAGLHRGGYDPFSFNITPYLEGRETQEIVVRVFDATDDGGQPRGKQTKWPKRIMYTSTTGIWQTVWLEPVPKAGIHSLKIVPDVDSSSLKLTTTTGVVGKDGKVIVSVKDGDKVVGTMDGVPGREMEIPIPNAKLWSPDSPFLYNLDIAAYDGDLRIDEVSSYFGMRKIEVADVGGVKKMLLNGKALFHFGPLDQGFWPDGIHTPPTEEALKNDIQTMKDLGFNMVRKHLKVEPARWYYWTDRLGLLVWQDMPSANAYAHYMPQGKKAPPVDKEAYRTELEAMVKHLFNSPSVVMWVVFNESQGQHDTRELVERVKNLDSTRLLNEASGGAYTGAGEVRDGHHYPSPACPPPNPKQALVCGEYGGIGFNVPGHMWVNDGFGYTTVSSPEELEDIYVDFAQEVKDLRDKRGMSGAVYTQLTDVETENNGLLTYDRIPKANIARIAMANRFELPRPVFRTIMATSEKQPQTWKYTHNPPGNGWMKKDFDDSLWNECEGPFGAHVAEGIEKDFSRIWLRRGFNPGGLTAEQIAKLAIRIHHGDDVEVFLNGVLTFTEKDRSKQFVTRPLTPEGRKAIIPNGGNILAISCKLGAGKPIIDAGILLRE